MSRIFNKSLDNPEIYTVSFSLLKELAIFIKKYSLGTNMSYILESEVDFFPDFVF